MAPFMCLSADRRGAVFYWSPSILSCNGALQLQALQDALQLSESIYEV